MSEHIYQQTLSCRTNKLLRDHRIHGAHLLPGIACVHWALQYSSRSAHRPRQVNRVTFDNPLILETSETKNISIHLEDRPAHEHFAIKTTSAAGSLVCHAEGDLRAGTPAPESRADLAGIQSRCGQEYNVAEFYKDLNQAGLAYGLYLQTVSSLHYNEREVLARLSFGRAEPENIFYPALLDGALQALAVLSIGRPVAALYYLEQFSLFQPIGSTAYCHGWLRADNQPQVPLIKYDLTLYSPAGQVVAAIKKAVFKHIPTESN